MSPRPLTDERIETGLPPEKFVSVVAIPARSARLGLALLAALLVVDAFILWRTWDASRERRDIAAQCGLVRALLEGGK